MANPEVISIAERLKKSPAQVLLRQLVQRGIVIIPKSTNAERLRDNFNIVDFELTDADMQLLKTLDKNFRICDFGFFKG